MSQRPSRPPAMYMAWHDLLFMHWPVEASALRPLVPAGLEIDVAEGSAWVGLVPFTMVGVRHRLLPPVPTMHHFPECNVRTYVTCRGEPGVWFHTLDAASRLAVWGGRTLWGVNYVHARITSRRDGDEVAYAVDRTAQPDVKLRARWRAGADLPPTKPGELAHFLTSRYVLFSHHRGRIYRGQIHHDPWPLCDAELLELEEGLVAAAGIEVQGPPPVLHHSDAVTVDAWSIERTTG